mmetsp:Transcript_35500/g.81952  ORF Transcript_35500/g.81952 Transcript_35500/m.81952 type:complete len:256 (-) Transcript_35500:835-1602(-)
MLSIPPWACPPKWLSVSLPASWPAALGARGPPLTGELQQPPCRGDQPPLGSLHPFLAPPFPLAVEQTASSPEGARALLQICLYRHLSGLDGQIGRGCLVDHDHFDHFDPADQAALLVGLGVHPAGHPAGRPAGRPGRYGHCVHCARFARHALGRHGRQARRGLRVHHGGRNHGDHGERPSDHSLGPANARDDPHVPGPSLQDGPLRHALRALLALRALRALRPLSPCPRSGGAPGSCLYQVVQAGPMARHWPFSS